jgi:hypothetical protein
VLKDPELEVTEADPKSSSTFVAVRDEITKPTAIGRFVT